MCGFLNAALIKSSIQVNRVRMDLLREYYGTVQCKGYHAASEIFRRHALTWN